MEQKYTIPTTNRYALFLDDPGDVMMTLSAKPEKHATSKEEGGKDTKGKENENKERIVKEQQAIENAAKGEGCTCSLVPTGTLLKRGEREREERSG